MENTSANLQHKEDKTGYFMAVLRSLSTAILKPYLLDICYTSFEYTVFRYKIKPEAQIKKPCMSQSSV